MVFTATVVKRNLPSELELSLDATKVTVDVIATLSALPAGRTRLESEEEFKFKGFWSKVFSVFARPAISKAHRKHIEAFKRFAETAETHR